MKPIKLKIEIIAFSNSKIECFISDETKDNRLIFNFLNGTITLTKENRLAAILRKNQHQFEKVIRSAIKGEIEVGKVIRSVFIEDFKFLNESDFTKYICVDQRSGKLDITTRDSGSTDIHKIFADGSFLSETKKSGYGGFTEDPEGKHEIFFQSFEGGSSNLMELLAVTEGLQRLQSVERLQVNTDSRFVIRGLVQWCHFWEHNNWQTAYGREVKFVKQWQHAFTLCKHKYVEFKWIKGHSGDANQDFCHQLAKEVASE